MKTNNLIEWLLIISWILFGFTELYDFATKNEITLKPNKWNCTASLIINNVAVCSEYKIKDTK